MTLVPSGEGAPSQDHGGLKGIFCGERATEVTYPGYPAHGAVVQ
jgi:hypothetical protein